MDKNQKSEIFKISDFYPLICYICVIFPGMIDRKVLIITFRIL